MANLGERWPFREPLLILYHVGLMVEIAAGLGAATWAFNRWVSPAWSPTLEAIDGFVFCALVIVIGSKLLWEVIRRDGLNILVAA